MKKIILALLAIMLPMLMSAQTMSRATGDVNGDGKVDINDVTVLVKQIVENKYEYIKEFFITTGTLTHCTFTPNTELGNIEYGDVLPENTILGRITANTGYAMPSSVSIIQGDKSVSGKINSDGDVLISSAVTLTGSITVSASTEEIFETKIWYEGLTFAEVQTLRTGSDSDKQALFEQFGEYGASGTETAWGSHITSGGVYCCYIVDTSITSFQMQVKSPTGDYGDETTTQFDITIDSKSYKLHVCSGTGPYVTDTFKIIYE